MQRTIGIIGTGWVGASVAISTLHAGVAERLLLYDAKQEMAQGEAMDLVHGSSFYPSATVRSVASIEALAHADAVVIAAGRGGTAEQSRLDLLRDNAEIVRDLADRLRVAGFDGLVVLVTNPVDVLTRVATETMQLPAGRVLGTGTMLETSRVRQMVGRRLELDPRSVHANVIGEHGDSNVILWSGARIGGRPVRQWSGWSEQDEDQIGEGVRNAAYEIIRRKGATNHAIGLVTAELLSVVFRDSRRILTVSRVQQGACGLSGVSLSLPAVVGAGGARDVVEPEASDEERRALQVSADLLSEAYASIGR